MVLSEEFRKLLSEAIGTGRLETVEKALDEPAPASVRLNPSKSEGVKLPILEGSADVPWSPYGHILKERPVFTLHPLFHSGVYYVQDSSAMFVGEVFREVLKKLDMDRPVRVLDLCAAPGGKTTDLAASLRAACGENFLLVANEVMRQRATVLADNVARWGDPNVVVTSSDPAAFSALKGFFDIIVADVPCSGEGMFRKDEEALAQWSTDNVALCASRQKRILADVLPALADGGYIVYSTCTFNREENDNNAKWLSEETSSGIFIPDLDFNGPIRTECGFSLVPGFVPGEGQYCAAVGPVANATPASRRKPSRPGEMTSQVSKYFNIPVSAKLKGDLVVAVPDNLKDDVEEVASKVSVVSSGVACGRFKGKDFIPDEDLALSTALRRGVFAEAPVDKPTALAFLHRDPVVLGPDAPRGTILVTYKNVPLGFVKNLGTRTNNLHPVSRRIRMDITR